MDKIPHERKRQGHCKDEEHDPPHDDNRRSRASGHHLDRFVQVISVRVFPQRHMIAVPGTSARGTGRRRRHVERHMATNPDFDDTSQVQCAAGALPVVIAAFRSAKR
jgi:hypothetical protein